MKIEAGGFEMMNIDNGEFSDLIPENTQSLSDIIKGGKESFYSVGQFYKTFTQLSDEEVHDVLHKC